MKRLLIRASGLLMVIGLLGCFGVHGTSAHTITAREAVPLASCKEMNEVAVVVASGDKFQRICLSKGSEELFSKVRVICNYTDVVVSFQDSTLEKLFEIPPSDCQKFELDDGSILVPSSVASHQPVHNR